MLLRDKYVEWFRYKNDAVDKRDILYNDYTWSLSYPTVIMYT